MIVDKMIERESPRLVRTESLRLSITRRCSYEVAAGPGPSWGRQQCLPRCPPARSGDFKMSFAPPVLLAVKAYLAMVVSRVESEGEVR